MVLSCYPHPRLVLIRLSRHSPRLFQLMRHPSPTRTRYTTRCLLMPRPPPHNVRLLARTRTWITCQIWKTLIAMGLEASCPTRVGLARVLVANTKHVAHTFESFISIAWDKSTGTFFTPCISPVNRNLLHFRFRSFAYMHTAIEHPVFVSELCTYNVLLIKLYVLSV